MTVVEEVLLGSLVLAAGLVVARGWTRLGFRGRNWTGLLGEPNWDFSRSWASTFTAVGAALGTVLATRGVLPDPTRFAPVRDYAGLSLFFGLLVIAAPFLYQATGIRASVPSQPPAAPGARTPVSDAVTAAARYQVEGFVWAYLVAAGLTLWAVIGQLLTVFLLLGELAVPGGGRPAWPWSAVVPAGAVFAATLSLLFFYAWRSMEWVIDARTDRQYHREHRGEHRLASWALF